MAREVGDVEAAVLLPPLLVLLVDPVHPLTVSRIARVHAEGVHAEVVLRPFTVVVARVQKRRKNARGSTSA